MPNNKQIFCNSQSFARQTAPVHHDAASGRVAREPAAASSTSNWRRPPPSVSTRHRDGSLLTCRTEQRPPGTWPTPASLSELGVSESERDLR